MSKLMNLKNRVKDFDVLLPFMEEKEKGDFIDLLDNNLTIKDFGFLKDSKTGDEYVCFIVEEFPKNFYFGGMVLTENMRTLEDEGYSDEIRKEGLPVKFGERQSKNNRKYTTVKFYPEG